MFSFEIGEIDDKVGTRNLYDAYQALMNSEKVKIVVNRFKNFNFNFDEMTPHMERMAKLKYENET